MFAALPTRRMAEKAFLTWTRKTAKGLSARHYSQVIRNNGVALFYPQCKNHRISEIESIQRRHRSKGTKLNATIDDISNELLVSMNMGWGISAHSHRGLVGNLVKRNLITNERAVAAFQHTDRRWFIPEDFNYSKEEIYDNRPLDIGYEATISTPQHHAQILDLIADHLIVGSKALDIGCGSGYLLALMAQLVGPPITVQLSDVPLAVGIDIVPELVELSRDNIRKMRPELLEDKLVEVVEAKGQTGWRRHAPYDVIHSGVAVSADDADEYVATLLEQLKPGGRMIIPVIDTIGSGQTLFQVDKDAEGNATRKELMKVLCQEMAKEDPTQEEVETVPHEVELEQVKHALGVWEMAFRELKGRRPTRNDLDSDPVAKELFLKFKDLRRHLR